MMKTLLQILIFTFFIFSNGYQGIITSFMLNPVEVPIMTTIEEVLDSDLKIEYNRDFIGRFEDNLKLKKAEDDRRFYSRYDERPVSEEEKKRRIFSVPCKIQQFRTDREGDGKSWRGLYMIEEYASSNVDDLYTRPVHFYLDNFQHYMDRSFEAGLHQAWETFYYLKLGEIYPRIPRQEEKTLLDFKDIAPFFFILAGFGFSLLAFLCEIFHKDFVSELDKEYLKKKFNAFWHRGINVRPIQQSVRQHHDQ